MLYFHGLAWASGRRLEAKACGEGLELVHVALVALEGEGLAGVAGDYVEMKVHDGLPRRLAVVLQDVEPVAAKAVLDMRRNPLHPRDKRGKRLVGGVEQPGGRRPPQQGAARLAGGGVVRLALRPLREVLPGDAQNALRVNK